VRQSIADVRVLVLSFCLEKVGSKMLGTICAEKKMHTSSAADADADADCGFDRNATDLKAITHFKK
jgi:hypothetical protein